MTVYILNLVSIVLYGVLRHQFSTPERFRASTLWLSRLVALQLILILSLRDVGIGVDVKGYVRSFELAVAGELTDSRYEPGFVLLTQTLARLTSDPHVFLSAVAFLSIAPLAVAFEKLSVDPLVSWFLYVTLGFYSFTFSGLRQAVALGVIAAALVFVVDRRPLLFISCLAVAAQFHGSAWVFAPAFLVYRARLSWNVGIAWGALGVVALVFRQQIFVEFTDSFYPYHELVESSSYNWLAFSAGLVLMILVQYKRIQEFFPRSVGFVSLVLVGLSLMSFASLGTNVMRIADYYFGVIVLALPAAHATLPSRTRRVVGYFGGLALVAVYLYLLTDSAFEIAPYRFRNS